MTETAVEAAVRRIRLRTTHPTLYKAITTFALLKLGLGLNFLLLKPAFNQYNLSKAMGVVFVVTGITKLILLSVRRDLKYLRVTMAVGVGSLFFYGGVLTTFWAQTGSTSLQLPLMYFGVAVLEFAFLMEPPTNPANRNGHGRSS